MNSLILIPAKNKIEFFFFRKEGGKELHHGCVDSFRNLGMKNTLTKIFAELRDRKYETDFAVLRMQYGGTSFRTPELVNEDVIKRLENMAGEAPLHIPPATELAKEFIKMNTSVPLVMIFETAFFTRLPEREANYAVSRELSAALKLRRFGYHGIYHQVAAEQATGEGASKVISICLEPRPEIAAVIDGCPVFSTSGATPLEGLPGEKSSGEIDPFIIITLNKKLGLGPEQINNILTEKSGLAGLTGENIELPEIFRSGNFKNSLARKIIEYRILLVCGSCVAAMGGVDMIIFSGRYHFLGKELEEYLKRKLKLSGGNGIGYSICSDDLPSLLSDFAESIIIGKKLRERKR